MLVLELRGIWLAALKHSGTWWKERETANKERPIQEVSLYPSPLLTITIMSTYMGNPVNVSKAGLQLIPFLHWTFSKHMWMCTLILSDDREGSIASNVVTWDHFNSAWYSVLLHRVQMCLWKKRPPVQLQQLEEKPACGMWLWFQYGLLPSSNAFKGEEMLPEEIASAMLFPLESEICYEDTTVVPLSCSWILACILWKLFIFIFSETMVIEWIWRSFKRGKSFP